MVSKYNFVLLNIYIVLVNGFFGEKWFWKVTQSVRTGSDVIIPIRNCGGKKGGRKCSVLPHSIIKKL